MSNQQETLENIDLQTMRLPQSLEQLFSEAVNEATATPSLPNEEELRRQWSNTTSMYEKTKRKIDKKDQVIKRLVKERKILEIELQRYKTTLDHLDRNIISEIGRRRNTDFI